MKINLGYIIQKVTLDNGKILYCFYEVALGLYFINSKNVNCFYIYTGKYMGDTYSVFNYNEKRENLADGLYVYQGNIDIYNDMFENGKADLDTVLQKYKDECEIFYKISFSEFKEEKSQKYINEGLEKINGGMFQITHKNKKGNNSYNKLGTFLTDIDYKANPLVGMQKELDKLQVGLNSPGKGNVILVGEAGIGKTALVEGLAYRIQNKNVCKLLRNKDILSISTSSIVSDTKYSGQLEEKMEELLKYLHGNNDVILFMDEIHQVIGAGTTEKSNIGISEILKPHLDRGELKVIGATTKEEYEKYIQNESAFARRFKVVEVREPNDHELKSIIIEKIKLYEMKTGISFIKNNREQIICKLIDLTNSINRISNKKISKPSIILDIISDSFGYASVYEHKTVKIEDIISSIDDCVYIMEDPKENTKTLLKKI